MRIAVLAVLALAALASARRNDGARALERGKFTSVSGKRALAGVVGHGTAVVACYHRSEDSFHDSINHVLQTVAEHFKTQPICFVSLDCDSAPNAQLCENLPVYQRSSAFFPSDKAHTARNLADWIKRLL